jgi:pimeloyl-ACP methyl ester carboxylesterase
VTVQVTSTDNAGNLSQAINILRPPIVLVHGIWGNPGTWTQFTQYLAGNASWLPAAAAADYSKPLSGRITSAGSTPAGFPPILANYLPFLLRSARENSLGFKYNAPIVQRFIRDTIAGYRRSASAAASRADIAGHSMGGW